MPAWCHCRLPSDTPQLTPTLLCLIFKAASDALTAKRILSKEHSLVQRLRRMLLWERQEAPGRRGEQGEHPAAWLGTGNGVGEVAIVY